MVFCTAFLFMLFSFSKLTSRGNKPSIRSIVVFILESGSKMSARDLSWWIISLARVSVLMSSEVFWGPELTCFSKPAVPLAGSWMRLWVCVGGGRPGLGCLLRDPAGWGRAPVVEGGLVSLASKLLPEVCDLEPSSWLSTRRAAPGMDLSLATVTLASLLELPGILKKKERGWGKSQQRVKEDRERLAQGCSFPQTSGDSEGVIPTNSRAQKGHREAFKGDVCLLRRMWLVKGDGLNRSSVLVNVALRFQSFMKSEQRIIVVFRGSYHKGADVSSVLS